MSNYICRGKITKIDSDPSGAIKIQIRSHIQLDIAKEGFGTKPLVLNILCEENLTDYAMRGSETSEPIEVMSHIPLPLLNLAFSEEAIFKMDFSSKPPKLISLSIGK